MDFNSTSTTITTLSSTFSSTLVNSTSTTIATLSSTFSTSTTTLSSTFSSTLSSTVSSTSVLLGVVQEESDAFIFVEWLLEWQVMVGLVMLLITFCAVSLFLCLVGCCEAMFGVENDHAEQTGIVIATITALWESVAMNLVLFGSLKHSMKAAVTVAMIHTFVRSLVVLAMMISEEKMINSKKEAAVKAGCLKVVSAYTDMEKGTVLQCLPVFGVQVTLYTMMLQSVWDRDAFTEALPMTDRQVVMFVVGAFVSAVMSLIVDRFESSEYMPFWGVYFHGEEFRSKRHFPVFRAVLSWVVNSFLASTAIFLIPIILMDAPDNMEFVKDATCILFIAEIDTILKLDDTHDIPLKGK